MGNVLARCFFESDPLAEAVMMELSLWNVPEELRGKVESVEEMNKKVLAHPRFSQSKNALEVYLRQHRQKRSVLSPIIIKNFKTRYQEVDIVNGYTKGYDIYSLISKNNRDWLLNIGYGCGECKSLMIGPPKHQGLLNYSLTYFCENCGIEMDSFDLEGRGKSWFERMHESIGIDLNESLMPLTR